MKKGPSRLLIVDDNEMNRDMLSRRLSRTGFVISATESALRLTERIKEEGVDLVLLDIEMPDISGLDALRILRQTYSATQLPVIMVTGRNQSDDIVLALEFGANDYLSKPIDFPVALARINAQLSYKHAEQALRESEERYALAARGSNDGLWDWNLAEGAIYFSPRWKAMLGYQEDEISGDPGEWLSRIHEADRDRVRRVLEGHQNGLTSHFEIEHRMLHKDGVFRWMLTRGVMVRDAAGSPLRMAGSQTDITEGKVADPLTGLPNRLLFIDRLTGLIEHQKRRGHGLFAVLFLDLDGFKLVNDSLGHTIGDKLLLGVATRLVKCLRSTDVVTRVDEAFTVARFGGDEFAILLDDLNDPGDATIIAERLLHAIAEPYNLDDKEIFTSASIGIALSSSEHAEPEDFLRDADTAMYRAKSSGKLHYEVFDAGMRAFITSRLQLETDLRRAIERNEFTNFYQPIVFLETGRVTGFEALLRWQHPERGLVEPDQFIPVAEETGMIREIGWWALREACRQMREWRKGSDAFSDLTMSVNLSAKQFTQPNLVGAIQRLLEELEFPPHSLTLELTESSVMSDPGAAVAMLLQMKSLGIRLAIDDFGTGYSSLSYLHRFPLDTLKIDRSFVSGMTKGDGIQIIRSIMPLAKNLGLDVVAEGVQTLEELQTLRNMQCHYAQGFYFSKAVCAEEAEEFVLAQLATTLK